MDWSSLVTQLVNADRAPQTAMKTQQTTNNSKISALATIKTQLGALASSLTSLQDSSLFNAHSATVGNSTLGWSAAGAAKTPNGNYTVAVTQLAVAAARQGTAHVGSAISASGDVSGVSLATVPTAKAVTAGNFQINGATVSVATTDSLQDVFNKINTATGGTVTGSYDPATDKVSLTSSSGNVVLGASNDTSNFLSVFKLNNNASGTVTSSGTLGSAQLSKPLASSNLAGSITGTDAGGNGTFSINGTAIAFNTGTDTVQSVLNKINASGAGVTAAYDVTTDRFTLTNKTTGDLGLSVSDSSGLLNAMGLGGGSTLVTGQDAQFSVNGGATQTSHGNTLTDASTGLSVTAATTGTSTVSVASDSTNATAAIKDFIAKYNAIQDTIANSTKITAGTGTTVTNAVLAGDNEIKALGSSLRSLAFSAIPGLNGASASRLQSFGIDFVPGSNDLAITNPDALSNALSTNAAGVANFFQDSTSGLAAKLTGYINTASASGGTIATQTDALNKRNASLTNQIAAMERKLTAEAAAWTKEFTALESIQATMKAQTTALTNAFNSKSNSDS